MSRHPGILQLCLTLDTGGLERVVVNLANELSMDGQFNSQICTVGQTHGELIKGGISPEVQWTELGGPPWATPRTGLRLARLVRKQRIRMIHAHGTQPLVYALFASSLCRVPVVFTKHNSYEDLSFFEKRPVFNRLACMRVKRFAGVSEQATTILQRVFARAARRCVTQINGTELPDVNVRAAAIRNRRERHPSKPLVLVTVCRLAPEKDLVTLLRAFASVHTTEPNSELWIVGDGAERQHLAALASELHIGEAVRFWGFRGKIQQILGCSDVFVNSSTTEGVSISILEAMSMGLPIAATSVGGTPTIVRDGENGILVEPGNPLMLAAALLKLLRNPALREQMGESSWREVERKWSLGRMADHYREMYSSVLPGVARQPVALSMETQ